MSVAIKAAVDDFRIELTCLLRLHLHKYVGEFGKQVILISAWLPCVILCVINSLWYNDNNKEWSNLQISNLKQTLTELKVVNSPTFTLSIVKEDFSDI